MNRRFQILLLAGCLVGLSGTMRAEAQEVRTLSIRDGKVYVDGSLLQKAELPASLVLADKNLQLSFVGEGRPVLELDGRLYRLDARRLVEVERTGEAPERVSVFFRDRTPAAAPSATTPSASASWRALRASGAGADYEAADEAAHYTFEVRALPQVQQLEAQAQALSTLSRKLEVTPVQNLDELVQEVRLQAEQNARLARVLPGLEVKRYLEEVQARDQGLYREIHRELLLEAETRELAARVAGLAEGPGRTEHEALLREKLKEIFELKQENRRREIAQLEERLDQLQVRLRERERMRDELVERRLQELIEQVRPDVW